MTKSIKSIKSDKGGLSMGQTVFCLMSALVMVITFVYSDPVIDSMLAGMKLCTVTVIPALFPFMVLSEMLVSGGALEILGRTVARPLSKMLDISKQGAAALVLGLICGFPIGSRSAISLYERGMISRGELEHLMAFCNLPGSAFLIGAVGAGMFGSRRFGVLLYAAHIVSALAVGCLSKGFFVEKKKKAEFCNFAKERGKREGAIAVFTKAVSNSASNMLMICAFIVFFSAVMGVVGSAVREASLPASLSALILGFFEMTGGVSAASGLEQSVAPVIAAVITGWSGLSIAFQFVGVCGDNGIGLGAYLFSKVLCALINGAIVWVAMSLLGGWIEIGGGDSVTVAITLLGSFVSPFVLALFIGGCVPLALRSKRRK